MNKIKVLVAGNSQTNTIDLENSLAGDERIEVCTSARSTQHVIDMVGLARPDVILVDSELLKNNGIMLQEKIQELYPEVKVIVLIPLKDMKSFLEGVVNTGAKGLLPETIDSIELVTSVIQTARGGTVIHPTVMPQIVEKLMSRIKEKTAVRRSLSEREREVMELVVDGRSNREIAGELIISENTVRGHIRRICDKLNVNSKVEMARYVLLNS